MGARGPVPNREADLARPRTRKGATEQTVTRGIARPVEIPEPDPAWHEIALMMWDALTRSGQTDFYQQSDWAFAYSLCEDLSMYKSPQITKDGIEYHKRSGQMLQTIYSAWERLLITEGDRRRLRIELDEPQAEKVPASVTAIADYRADLGLTEPPEGDDT